MRWFVAIVTFVFTGSVAATDMSVDQAVSRLLKDIKDVEVMRVPVLERLTMVFQPVNRPCQILFAPEAPIEFAEAKRWIW